MHSFRYHAGKLHCENVDLSRAAEEFGTPVYVYSAATILDHYRRLNQALVPLDHLICYAVKANSNRAILKLLAEAGAGFDIVSGGELFRVRAAGGDPAKFTFAGVGKSREEIEAALEAGVYSFNVESEAELEYIDGIAGKRGAQAPIAIRINPNVDSRTHAYITTGSHENKFGIAIERAAGVYDCAASMRHVKIVGAQMHIGSQITESQPFVDAIAKAAPLVRELKHKHGIKFFSIGGGIGIVYQSSFESGEPNWWKTSPNRKKSLSIQQYVEAILPALQELELRILLEPGRLLVGNAGILLTRIQYIKQTGLKRFAIIDAGMNDLIRPALYHSYHEILPGEEIAPHSKTKTTDIVGPVCETGDFLGLGRELPAATRAGDLLAVMSAGAYGFAMASNYNSRPLPAEALVEGDRIALIRQRQSVQDLIRDEVEPKWR